MSRCCICQRRIAGTAWVCRSCRERWSLPKSISEWPRWARACKAYEQRQRADDILDCLMLAGDDNCAADILLYGEIVEGIG